jgi:hypothetical protein
VHLYPGRTLHEGLHDHRCDLAGVLAEEPGHVPGVAGLRLERVEEQGPVHLVEQVDASGGHRADGVAVVGVA